ncbi:MAG: lipopolysaccharide biosynthesis protein, partial [Chthoniobacterales bacterium]
ALVCLRLGIGSPGLPVQLRNRLFRFTTFSWASTLANELVWARLEMAFLGHFWGSGAIGLYSVGFTLASLATQGPLLLTGGLLPYFAEAISSNRLERATTRLQTAMRLVAFFVLPMCFGMAALIPELLPLLYGNSFAAGSVAAMILVSSAGLGANVVVPLAFINGMERSDFLFAVNITGALLSLALGLILVAWLGIVGAALARASVLIFILATNLWFLHRRLRCDPPLAHLALLFASALASALVAGLLASHVPGLPGLLLSVPAAAVVYILLVRALRAIPDEDIESLEGLFAHVPAPLQRGTAFALSAILGNRRG